MVGSILLTFFSIIKNEHFQCGVGAKCQLLHRGRQAQDCSFCQAGRSTQLQQKQAGSIGRGMHEIIVEKGMPKISIVYETCRKILKLRDASRKIL